MQPDPSEDDPIPAQTTTAAATIARVLEEVGIFRPERIDFETTECGGLLARVVIEKDVCELVCELTREGDLISARLLEL